MSVEIRTAQQVSADLVNDLNVLLPQLSSSAAALTETSLDAMLASPGTTMFLAYNDQRLIGTLTLVVFAIPTGLRAWIEDVVVDQSARGLGAGVALTQAAIDLARSLGVRSIDLTSRPSREAANALYLKVGFELRETNVYRYSLEG